MSKSISRALAARLGLSLALGVTVLVVMSFLGARVDRATSLGEISRIHVPAGAPWCGPVDQHGNMDCRYLTFERCLEAADADYRTCKPNPAAIVVADDAPYWTYRSVFSERGPEMTGSRS
jgi:hypothetical protein